MSRRIVTERKLSGSFPGEGKIGTWERLGRTDIIGRAIKADCSHGSHDSSGYRVRGACAAIIFPDTAPTPPVGDGKVTCISPWSCVNQHSERKTSNIPTDSWRVMFGYLRYSHGTSTRPSDRALMAKSRSG